MDSQSGSKTLTLPKVHLASRSPRRSLMLREAGIDHDAAHPGIDDGGLTPGRVSPEQWVAALAYLKARSALAAGTTHAPIVLGADTMVVSERGIMGQPVDGADATRMLRALRDAEHDVVTGVALVDAVTGRRTLFSDRTRVRVGMISDAQIADYVASGLWRGKAGAYNLVERIEAGWPITVEGDPGTVMGLPIRVLAMRIAGFAEAPK